MNFDVDHWDRLPWWQQIMYTRQMEVAASERQSGEVETEGNLADELTYRMQADEPLPLAGPGSGATADGTTGVLQGLGINVVRVQFGDAR